MEKINTEILVSSLFLIGFDQVDAMLFTYTLGKLSIDNQKLNLFKFEDKETTNTFNKYFEFDRMIYKLKEGYTLNDIVSSNEKYNIPLRRILQTNKKLLEYLEALDFKEIILRKISDIGYERIEKLNYLFSEKEKEIVHKIIDINLMKQEESILQLYENEQSEEFQGTEKVIKTLKKQSI